MMPKMLRATSMDVARRLTDQLAYLKGPRHPGNHGVVGKRRIAMRVIRDVGHTDLAIALHRPGTARVQAPAPVLIHHAGFDGDDVSGSAESVA